MVVVDEDWLADGTGSEVCANKRPHVCPLKAAIFSRLPGRS